MHEYEYKVVKIDAPSQAEFRREFHGEMAAWLNRHGADGWLLVQVDYPTAIFVRRIVNLES